MYIVNRLKAKKAVTFFILFFVTIQTISVLSGNLHILTAIAFGLTYLNGFIIGILWSKENTKSKKVIN
jgi:hypothetical protein